MIFSEKEKFEKEKGSVITKSSQHDTMATHLVDHAFHVLVNKQVEIEHKNYLQLRLDEIDISHYDLPKRYVVITTGYTAKVREFIPESVNDVIRYVKRNGYEVVFLGRDNVPVAQTAAAIKGNFSKEIDFHKGYNLVNKTNLLEAGKIMALSKCVIGNDNGLLHLAGCSSVPIIFGCTTVEPRLRLPFRNNILGWNCFPVVPDDSIKCRYCQSNFVLVYNVDFRLCVYGDSLCCKNLTFDKWKEQIDRVL